MVRMLNKVVRDLCPNMDVMKEFHGVSGDSYEVQE